ALPHFRDRTRTQLPQAGLLRIECDVGHTWMRAYILISSSPFSAVTGGEGTFEIRGIPPGRYRLLAWHEAFGTIEREVNLAQGEQSTLTLVFGATRE
ncbi:MAG: carboxypeptidase-like regulatory domain-containing protein, partial [Candidatus Methylomirabilales bacterium]